MTADALLLLPDGLDEILFAGFIRKKSVELVPCKTIDLEVPGDVDFVLEGTIRWERGAGRESRLRITPELIQVADDDPDLLALLRVNLEIDVLARYVARLLQRDGGVPR